MSRDLAALFAATVCVGTAVAQTTPAVSTEAPLTLDDALASARARSPGLDAADASVRATTAGRTVAGLRPNPSFEGQAENIVGTGPYRGLSGSETTVGFSLPIETGGKRSARVAVADTRIGRAKLGAFVALADLELQVTETYVEAVGAERRLLVARQQAAIATEGLRVARDRVMVGAASPIDQQRADVVSINANVAVGHTVTQQDVMVPSVSFGAARLRNQHFYVIPLQFSTIEQGAAPPTLRHHRIGAVRTLRGPHRLSSRDVSAHSGRPGCRSLRRNSGSDNIR